MDHHLIFEKKYFSALKKCLRHRVTNERKDHIQSIQQTALKAVVCRDGAQRTGEVSFIVDTCKTFDLHLWKKSDQDNRGVVN